MLLNLLHMLLLIKNPELFKQIDTSKHKEEELSSLSAFSHKRMNWIGLCSHPWIATVAERSSGNGCPYCSGRKILIGYNDLKSKRPDIAKEWHPTMNKKTAEMFTVNSGVGVWWLCERQHHWPAVINNRTANKSGCPYCASKKAWFGFNDLETKNPELAKQWHPTKNGKLQPRDLLPGSNKKVWWSGECEHEWDMRVYDRVYNSSNCPFCLGRKILTGENDLASKRPDLASQWHPTKNKLNSNQVTCNSQKLVWWICEKGHEHECRVASKNDGIGCHYCSNKKILAGENDLVTNFPKLVKEWDYDNNSQNKPEDFTPGSSFVANWICSECDKKWPAQIKDRTTGHGCPSCCFTYTNLEKTTEKLLSLEKFDKCVLIESKVKYRPDFKLTETVYLNVDGLRYHSEAIKSDKNYHRDMRKAYETEGKRILQFYEDEIHKQPEIVKSIVDAKLNKFNIKLNARQCEVRLINKVEAEGFLDSNHLIGKTSYTQNIGLYYKNELVYMFAIKHSGSKIELIRCCSKIGYCVRGAFGKLLKHCIIKYQPEEVVTLIDLRYATGDNLEKMGFKKIRENLQYVYTNTFIRKDKRNFRVKAGTDERQEALDKGWYRLWDAGKATYVLDTKKPTCVGLIV